jgi:GPH family glycoside/pentoside/hexuronide:cation symporter
MLAYGGPVLGLSYLLFFVQFYFLKFATDVLLLPPAIVGLLFAVAKAWNAVSDPLVGSWSDRTRSRRGRRRPYLFAALPLLAAGFALLWAPPAGLSPGWLLAWVGAGLVVFYTAFTLYQLPHLALGAELSADSHQRTRLFGARHLSFTIGMLVSFGAIQVAMNAGDPRAMAAAISIPGAVLAVALLAVTPLAVREPAGERSGGTGLRAALRDVLANRPARMLLFVFFVESLGVGAVGTMAPYVAEYLLGRPDVVGVLPAAYVLTGVLTIPIWVRLSRSFGKRETWLASMWLAAAAFGGMFFVGEGQVLALMGLLVFAGAAMGSGGVLSASILADVIDLDEQRTGERKEGVYSASMQFVMKIGTTFATAASGVVLSLVGFAPNVEQSPESLLGIRILFAGLPCAGFLIGGVVYWRSLRQGAGRPRVAPLPAGD